MSNSSSYEIRTMSAEDLKIAIGWAKSEGWNPGLHDAKTFHAIDPEGFLMGWLDGQPIGSISAVDWGDGFGFIGLYIVLPEFRGKGYGIQLWQAAMERLAGKTIGLDGVVAQQDNYARSGFQLAHRNLRFEGTAGALAGESYGREMTEADVSELQGLDIAPSARPNYFSTWLQQTDAVVLRSENALLLCRTCHNGVKLGPVIAPGREEAKKLIGSACSRLSPETPVFLDIPETNPEALALVQGYGMSLQFETARMYHGEQPSFEPHSWFGITTLELG